MAGSRIDHAEAALASGAIERASTLLDDAARAGERTPETLWMRLVMEMLRGRGPAVAEDGARRGLAQHPQSADLHQFLGIALRRQRRLDDALEALETARRLNPNDYAALFNLANVHNDRGDSAAAQAALDILLPMEPANAELRYMLGRARRSQGDFDGADEALAEALELDPAYLEAWRERATLASERQRHDDALRIIDESIARFSGDHRLVERRAELLVRAGRLADARADLEQVLKVQPDAAWACNQLARLLTDSDLAAALAYAERATALAPKNGAFALTRANTCYRASGAGRPDLLQTAVEIVQAVTAGRAPPIEHAFVVRSALAHTAAADQLEGVADFAGLGRYWAMNGQHAALFSQLPLADTSERRRELLDQHRLWGRAIQLRADQRPVTRPPRPTRRDKLRVGFLSSDLRRHAVGHFARALFDHYDRNRFELFAYSFYPRAADDVQTQIASQAASFRCWPDIAEHEAAQRIADDHLDILLDLGATTRWNFAQVLAYRPAPLQASWLGYPHSVGLGAIDHLILDPHLSPTALDLLIESPLLMPKTWIALSRGAFGDDPAVADQPPSARNGYVTFGSANNPSKYGRPVLAAWAQVMAAVPNSRFLFLRPEAAAPAFQANVSRLFSAAGVSPDRLEYEPTLAGHMAHYNRIDISLDTFPLTGGTTTCESLWMGVPVVSQRGEAVFQRLSHSILTNAGLGDLSVETTQDFVETAIGLADDVARRTALRRTLRADLRTGPLGDTETFTRDFFDLLARAAAG